MGSVQKRGEKFYARAKLIHNYITKTKGKSFDTQAEAWAWVERTEKDFRLGEREEVDETKTLKDALIRYMKEVSPTKKSADWEITKIKSYLNQDYCPLHYPLVKITPRVMREWRDKRDVANSSKNREMTLFSTLFQTCIEDWMWMETNPVRSVRRLKEPKHRDRRYAEHEIQLILNRLGFEENKTPTTQNGMIAIIFLIALETAMRQSEIVNTTWNNVFLNERYLRIPDTKNDDRRNVPLSRRAIELFEMMEPKRSGTIFDITADTVSTMFRRAVSECEIEDLTFHDTRHEACTRLARKLEVLDLAKMIGHRDLKSLMIYYNPTAAELADRLG